MIVSARQAKGTYTGVHNYDIIFHTDTSDYLNELLSGETSGTVHSVYRKTINLSIGGTLAALQAKGSPISPISLITTLTSEKWRVLKYLPEILLL